MTNRHRALARHAAALLAIAALAVSPTACRSGGRRNPLSMTSAELVAAGERDTAFVRRVRMIEEIAARIPTDSLARLYVAALDAPAERAAIYQNAIHCQYYRMLWQYGRVASPRAIRRMQDSLFATPAALARWDEAQGRWPTSPVPGYSCDASDLPRAPDSLQVPPLKSVWP
jgi:hypothetical protein